MEEEYEAICGCKFDRLPPQGGEDVHGLLKQNKICDYHIDMARVYKEYLMKKAK